MTPRSTPSSSARSTYCTTQGCVKTPAGGLAVPSAPPCFARRGWGALSLPLDDISNALNDGKGCMSIQEELGIAAADGAEQRIAVLGGLGERLAEGEGVLAAVVGEVEVVRGDGRYSVVSRTHINRYTRQGKHTRNSRRAGADSLQGRLGTAVLEDNPQLGELLIEHLESGKELLFGVHVGDVRAGRAGDLAVEVEDHVVLFHLREDGEEFVVIADAGRGVGGHACTRQQAALKEEWLPYPGDTP
ncbi:hypothetical protein GB937_009317 [Aspergillus fischeri]|nr:hypothetical protein GB937_009317 [Aspergillus fischeri]